MPDSLWLMAALCLVFALAFLIGAVRSLRRRRPLRMSLRLLLSMLLLALGAAFGATAVGIQGYRALTREDVAVVVQTQPMGEKRFLAQLRFADGRRVSYMLAGDELYVDARILKWHPLVNIFGLHTAYELDRVAGRYKDIGEEKQNPRTVQSLAPERMVDLFGLRQRYALLSPLLDAEYGSATFIDANMPATFEVRVTTSGLLVRRLEPAS